MRARLRDERGMTLVEVVVASLMVGLIAMSLVGLEAVGRATQDQRVRSQAAAVAQQDQERLRGMTADQLAKLSQTRTVTVEGTPFTVTSTGQFLSSSSGASSCAGADADYAKVISSVTWANNKRTPVIERSIITPNAGGSLLAKTVDQNGAALAGVGITASGSDTVTGSTRRTALTDTDGCAIFAGLAVGDFAVAASLSNYVDKDGNSAPSTTASTTSGNTSQVNFTLGQPGKVTATFSTVINGITFNNQQAPSVSWNNPSMATPGTFAPSSSATSITTPKTLFPFITGVPGQYNGNYTLWAGRCPGSQPPTNLGIATVPPGSDTPTATIQEPAMILGVQYRSATTNPFSAVKPTRVRLTYPQPAGSSCGQTWTPPLNAAAGPAAPATGWLQLPGQPYGTGYTACAEYKPNSNTYFGTATVNNTSYAAAGNPVTVSITGVSANQGTCP
jgi:Tfp pilus assembly protein PilV